MRRDGADSLAFSLTLVAAIALTPIVWLHYFAFLVVPLAIARPRFSWVWLLMWVFWLIPGQESKGDLWRMALALAVVGAVVALCAAAGRRASAAAHVLHQDIRRG